MKCFWIVITRLIFYLTLLYVTIPWVVFWLSWQFQFGKLKCFTGNHLWTINSVSFAKFVCKEYCLFRLLKTKGRISMENTLLFPWHLTILLHLSYLLIYLRWKENWFRVVVSLKVFTRNLWSACEIFLNILKFWLWVQMCCLTCLQSKLWLHELFRNSYALLPSSSWRFSCTLEKIPNFSKWDVTLFIYGGFLVRIENCWTFLWYYTTVTLI